MRGGQRKRKRGKLLNRIKAERRGRTDGVLGILSGLVNDGTPSARSSVRAHLDVGSDDSSGRAEEILEILPGSLERKLNH
jgi:hypothetical protein